MNRVKSNKPIDVAEEIVCSWKSGLRIMDSNLKHSMILTNLLYFRFLRQMDQQTALDKVNVVIQKWSRDCIGLDIHDPTVEENLIHHIELVLS